MWLGGFTRCSVSKNLLFYIRDFASSDPLDVFGSYANRLPSFRDSATPDASGVACNPLMFTGDVSAILKICYSTIANSEMRPASLENAQMNTRPECAAWSHLGWESQQQSDGKLQGAIASIEAGNPLCEVRGAKSSKENKRTLNEPVNMAISFILKRIKVPSFEVSDYFICN